MPRTILKARARARAQAQTETGQSRVSRIQGGVDLPFLMLTIVLVAIGLVMLLSASYPSAYYDLRGGIPCITSSGKGCLPWWALG